MVIPFDRCIARPDNKDGQKNLLRDHLVEVATACGSEKGNYEERIAFLAGLLHDVAKAYAKWQYYIREELEKGPPHAPLGSALFAYCAESLIKIWQIDRIARLKLYDLALDWTRVIYDHHGQLDDLEGDTPWDQSGARNYFAEVLYGCDTDGIFDFIVSHFPGIQVDRKGFEKWLKTFPDQWEKRVRRDRGKQLMRMLREANDSAKIKTHFALSIPRIAAQLVAADRYHAGDLHKANLSVSDAKYALQRLLEACKKKAQKALEEGADPLLVSHRQAVQEKALREYLQHSQNFFYSLKLPTGYGKTLSALRIALTACASGQYQRVIYVAPYLSILSQNTEEISETTGLEAIQHHHLSLAELDDDEVEVTETWQTPILTTTFNQFFRAIFPRRAHQCLRIEALKNAFVIIDEPQIIDLNAWNIFLRILSIVAEDCSFQVLFSTATLPPVEEGILHSVIPLAPKIKIVGRYDICMQPDIWKEADVAKMAIKTIKKAKSVALIMNTVQDAARVYKRIKESKKLKDVEVFCLTALMLPAHKAKVIQKINKSLKKGKRVIAVCTQILEAGVDLSFQVILRALPIFPSITQAAGRANRHGEGERAKVIVFEFVREDGNLSRSWVYRDKNLTTQTDRLLEQYTSDVLPEENLVSELDQYYRTCWDVNSYTALLQNKVEKAAHGKWSELAGIQPFVSGPPTDNVFVNQPMDELSGAMQRLQAHFAPEGCNQLLDRFLDWKFRKDLNFLERKRLSALFRQYLVPVNRKIAIDIGEPLVPMDEIENEEDSALWRLINAEDYCSDTGFAHLLATDEQQIIAIF